MAIIKKKKHTHTNDNFEGLPILMFSICYSIHPFGPAGSVCSSSDDMTKWLKLITSEGKSGSGESLILDYIMTYQFRPVSVLSPMWARAFSLQPQFPVKFDSFAYGYGWFVSYYRGMVY